jgi:formate hydrogenlyase subunit 4
MKPGGRPSLSPELIFRLQTTAGNRVVQRLLDRRLAEQEILAPERSMLFRFWPLVALCISGVAASLAVWLFLHHRTLAGELCSIASVIFLTAIIWLRWKRREQNCSIR